MNEASCLKIEMLQYINISKKFKFYYTYDYEFFISMSNSNKWIIFNYYLYSTSKALLHNSSSNSQLLVKLFWIGKR